MKILDNFLNQFQEFLPKVITQFSYDNRLQQALLYATMNGGKRIRPLLCFIIAHTVNKQVSISNILAMSLALEVVHCYSLVHDDLPAMDNDDLRRGLPTTHKQFDEPTAILVGDALQTMAFQIISSHYILQDAEIKLKLNCSNKTISKGLK